MRNLLDFLGYCLIINNEVFSSVPGDQTSRAMPNREGTQRDAGQNLSFLQFYKPMLYQVLPGHRIYSRFCNQGLNGNW